MNRKIALSSLSIMGALLIMGGATFAAFTTQATLGENTFATGNADLQISESQTTGFASAIDGMHFTNIYPGFTDEKEFWLKNNSASEIGLEVKGDLANLGGSFHGTDGSLPDKMAVQFVCDTDDNGFGGSDTTSGPFSVRQWIDGGDGLLATIAQGETLLCKVVATLDSSAGNELQNSDISFNAIFNGNQVANPVTPELEEISEGE